MLWVFLLNLLSLSITHTPAEPVDRWLVQLRQADKTCLEEWHDQLPSPGQVTIKAMPIETWYALKVPASLSAGLKTLPCVLQVMEDRKLEWRSTTPNDPQFNNQNDMDLIGMPEAWDVSTGGLTQQGDTIVVAIIDEGFQHTHPDLVPNRWYNFHEIPDDGVDNDANGFTDDFEGWNFSTQNDMLPIISHGTSVAGIIGARGNNNQGVTGVNWNVRMMLLAGADVESELVEAYGYVRDMRVAYDNSGGTAGAFVVACNLSAGLDFEFAENHPMWCAMYDRLGEVGILSAVAGPNKSHDVDVVGDMPSTCTSQYMIAVTNVDLQDEIVYNAGYGDESIDIGAPGHGTITIAYNNTYAEFTGTSAAAPHLAGTIALMYSTPCEYFLDGIDDQPHLIAQKVRDIIFQTATPNNSLQEITVTGKRLQTDAAMEATNNNCAPTPDDKLEIIGINPNPAYGDYVDVLFQVVGDTANTVFEMHMTNGALVRQFAISASEFSDGLLRISTSGLPGGIYLLTLRNSTSEQTRKLFVP